MSRTVKLSRSIFLAALLSSALPVHAQTPDAGWRWVANANIFSGLNYQYRKSNDVKKFEAQNWFMGMGERPLGRGRLTVHTMFSLEPFTLADIGSPQVFQTGETFNNVPLIDYQHPHDLISTLSASYVQQAGAWTLTSTAAAVGSPALGPPPFMHRPSAAENPQSPLAHHHLDSVHITPGVLTFGAARSGAGIETSWFRGREPDEDRTDIDLGALDSWSVRGSFTRGGWSGQISGARVNEPEPLEPGDMTRLMASISHVRSGAISTAVMAAWGQNRKSHGTSNGFVFESNMSWLEKNYLYSRMEFVGKELPHAHGGVAEPLTVSTVGAFTLGYTRDIFTSALGKLGIGGDTTMYYVPAELQESYGAPLSFHVFLRYRFATPSQTGMEHHH